MLAGHRLLGYSPVHIKLHQPLTHFPHVRLGSRDRWSKRASMSRKASRSARPFSSISNADTSHSSMSGSPVGYGEANGQGAGHGIHSLRWASSCSLATRSNVSSADLMR
jgi:hypothetical protein